MIARGQGKKAQEARLSLGCCPIHGLFMSQESPWLSRDEAEKFGFAGPEGSVCLVRCPRKDCKMYALARGPEEIVKVLTPRESSIAEELIVRQIRDFHRFLDLVKAEQRTKKTLSPEEWEQCYQLGHREPS